MCDTLCVRSRRGTLFAKNSDRPPDEVQVVVSHPPRSPGATLRTQYLAVDDPGAAAVVGSQPTWLWGFEHGFNEHRVAIGNERVFTRRNPHHDPPGLIGMDLVRLALERATTAADAVRVIGSLVETHGQGGSCRADGSDPYYSSFLVADPHEAWVLDTAGRSWAAAPRGTCAVTNRLNLRDDWVLASPDVVAGTDIDTWRHPGADVSLVEGRRGVLERAIGGLEDPLDLVTAVPVVLGALRSHDGPAAARGMTVCMHSPEFDLRTTASMVVGLPADPDEHVQAWACLGSPCNATYLPVAAATMGLLGSPEWWAHGGGTAVR